MGSKEGQLEIWSWLSLRLNKKKAKGSKRETRDTCVIWAKLVSESLVLSNVLGGVSSMGTVVAEFAAAAGFDSPVGCDVLLSNWKP
ncbi:hypothetical protein HAX54_027616 [Datura stramonium]|uniref:Uncharacterized protein n=1 Tax=Datura stramonium TaxID=4076 RepID=A0ABS8S8Y7_DATST|nr:hypothetical protein [Datura stramonium]